MKFEWDKRKNLANIAKHGIAFDAVERFDWENCQIKKDTRKDYGEDRFSAAGLIKDRLHLVVYTIRGETRRIIGLRKANKREEQEHGC